MRRDLVLGAGALTAVLGALAAFGRVFTEPAWRGPAMVAAVVAVLLAAGCRRLGLPSLVSGIVSIVGLFLTTYVMHLGAGPLLPGPEQFREAMDLGRLGFLQVREQPSPAAPLDGLVFLVATVTWVTAFVTHEVVVRARLGPASLAAPATLWIIPLAIPTDGGRAWPHALPFLVAAVILLLLTAEQDVEGWASDRAGPRLSGAGAVLGLTAVLAGVAAPGVLPGYDEPAWLEIESSRDPRGYQPIVDVGDRLRLPTARDILAVRSPRRTYLRIAALDTFDGTTWRLGPPGATTFRPESDQLYRASDPLPPETPIAEQTPLRIGVQVLDLENIYVPVPYQPLQILGAARSEMVYSTVGGFVATAELRDNGTTGDLRVGVLPGVEYDVDAILPTPSYDQLVRIVPGDDVSQWTELPGPYDAMRQAAELVYEAAGAETAVDRALALQDWFSGRDSAFTYSTDVPELRGDQALQRFVFETQRGYCEYFATAMAVMLRATGIPARVAVGFLPGRATSNDNQTDATTTYIVSSTDAHAWVEVLFPGYGWIKFEPTPRSDGATLTPTADSLDPVITQRERRQQEGLDPADPEGDDIPTVRPEDRPDVIPPQLQPPGQAPGGGIGGGRNLPLMVLLLTGVGAAALTVVAWTFAERRELRPHIGGPAGRVTTAHHRVVREAERLGIGRRAAETAHETSYRIAQAGRGDRSELMRLADLYGAAGFGDLAGDPDAVEAEQLATRAVATLRETADRRDRVLGPVRRPVDRLRSLGPHLASVAAGLGRRLNR